MENEQKTNNNTSEPSLDEAKRNEKIMSAICYIPMFFLIPLFLVKDKKPALNFHINQGIILSILSALGYFVVSMLPFFTRRAIDIWKLIILIFAIIGIINACNNKEKPLPIIGKLLKII